MTSLSAAAPDPGHSNHASQSQGPEELSAALTFSDVSAELLELHFDAQNDTTTTTNTTTTTSTTTTTTPTSATSATSASQNNHRQTSNEANPASTPQGPENNNERAAAATPSPASSTSSARATVHHPRRPSPGLAARLKALGFGQPRKPTSPPPSSHHLEPVGRLPEEQIRKLDQGHQASSTSHIVERRGRPWKGAIGGISPKSSNQKQQLSKSDHNSNKHETGEDAGAHENEDEAEPEAEAMPEFLPEIAVSQPLDMETHKYRTSVDHGNGNGNGNGNGMKIQSPERRRDPPLGRDTPPPRRIGRQEEGDETPPPPLPKDTPPRSTPPGNYGSNFSDSISFSPNSGSYFNPLGLQRPGSIYTLSRASFANQLAQLTSIQLPDAESLSSKVSAIPTAQAAAAALVSAAEQIRGWISKASEVMGGLESEDDVEWAAAGGREGVEEVESAIVRFEELIGVYVSAIEELQARNDIGSVSADDLRKAVEQMEAILEEWSRMRRTLQSVKGQVEIAMEWEELWNIVLSDIQNEMDELSRLVFEMEERRHKSLLAATSGDNVDIGDLETIVEETPPSAAARAQAGAAGRFSLPVFPVSPSSPSPGATGISLDDSSLLALFARMQPLRASLDFLPMRLAVFEARADDIFPSACEELEMRRHGLDASYKKLEKDAESLRKELGEDRWVLVFRGAGRQAQKMYESVERSTARLKEAVDAGMHLTNQPAMGKKIETYEAKKTHYGPAIERVLSIIDKGVKDRLTVNGEILRLHTEMQAKWAELKERMAEMDMVVEDMQADKGQQLRDSISSMLSNDPSTVGSGNETPGSSPPSSVIMSSLGLNKAPRTGKTGKAGKTPSVASKATTGKKRSGSVDSSRLPQPGGRRNSSLPTPASQAAVRKALSPRISALSTPPRESREGSATPTGSRASSQQPALPASLTNRPRWNSSTNPVDVDTGHNFKPLSLTTPSPYAKKPITPSTTRSQSALTPSTGPRVPAHRSPLSRATSSSPVPEDGDITALSSKGSAASPLSFRERIAAASPVPGQYPPSSSRRPRLAHQASMSNLQQAANRRASLQPPKPGTVGGDAQAQSAASPVPRPASSLASSSSRRHSLLPQPRPLHSSSTMSSSISGLSGRETPQGHTAASLSRRKNSIGSVDSGRSTKENNNNKPRWRG